MGIKMKKILLLCYLITHWGFTQTNYSVFFDGVNDSLSIDHSNTYNFGTGDFAIEFWYKSAQLIESSVSVIKKKNSTRYFEIIPSSGNDGLPAFVFGNGSSVYYAYGCLLYTSDAADE